MRVALIAPLFESVPPRLYGGTERVVHNLCRGLAAAGVHVTLFASADSRAEAQIVPVIDEALRLRENPVADPYAYNLKMLGMVASRAREFDVVHNHHDYWMLPLSEMTETPLVSTLHGRMDLPDQFAAFTEFKRPQFVAISDSQRAQLASLSWLATVHHGIDVSEFEFSPEPGKYLAFLGRISLDKRPEWAIEIARRSGIPLKIAAKIEGSESQEYYDAKIAPHVDGRFIEFVGEISEREKSEFLRQALALVFPIDWPEPFGLVMIESLACGTPVLARPCGAVPELLCDGVTGYTSGDITVLARRAGDVASLDRGGCRRWVQDRFSLNRMTEDYINVYRRVIAAGARGRPGHRRHLLHSV